MYSEILTQLCQKILFELDKPKFNPDQLTKIIRQFPKDKTGVRPFFTKSEILNFYKKNTPPNKRDIRFIKALQVKPIRTQSGVATVTILTKPYPCPGQCIFCPADIRMPKSYLNSEPGAQRAETNFFDPYLQVTSRLLNLYEMGHALDKIELIILGGTWTAYPLSYQRWFISQAFQALNEFNAHDQNLGQKRQERERIYLEFQTKLQATQQKFLSNNKSQNAATFQKEQSQLLSGSCSYNQLVNQLFLQPEKEHGLDKFQTATLKELQIQQQRNETTKIRNVGLVIETRPDEITPSNLWHIRQLGCTKVQIGVQSVSDDLLSANHRGITTTQIKKAFALLRIYGFKTHAHFMANLYQSNPTLDKKDFRQFFTDPNYQPDELKLYPCSLISSAPLYQLYQQKKWQPYSEAELLDLLTHHLLQTPAYCRLTRMIRDISSDDIVTGNKKTNFRQIVDQETKKSGQSVVEIRSREIRNQTINPQELELHQLTYQTNVSTEYFLEFVTHDDYKIAGFLRLSLPSLSARSEFMSPTEVKKYYPSELESAAIIREIHVYGQMAQIGEKNSQGHKAQHLGLGNQLIEAATDIARQHNFDHLAVISAIGTKEYYRHQGFQDADLYQIKNIVQT